jgi:hypothetical protein
LCLCARHRLVQYANAHFYKKLFCAGGAHGLGLLGYCLTRLTQWATCVKHFFDENRENFPIGCSVPLGAGLFEWKTEKIAPLGQCFR